MRVGEQGVEEAEVPVLGVLLHELKLYPGEGVFHLGGVPAEPASEEEYLSLNWGGGWAVAMAVF